MPWRTGAVRIELNRDGIREMLNFVGVEADLSARAERVAATVNATYPDVEGGRNRDPRHELPGSDVPIAVASVRGRGVRARARVTALHPSAPAVEAKYGIMGAALDSARGPGEPNAKPIGPERDEFGRFKKRGA